MTSYSSYSSPYTPEKKNEFIGISPLILSYAAYRPLQYPFILTTLTLKDSYSL